MDTPRFKNEDKIYETIFFEVVESEGKKLKKAHVNYLAFLNLHLDSKFEALEQLKSTIQDKEIANDVAICLEVINWRPHLIACLSLILNPNLILENELWNRIKDSSWVIPQLCITALLYDDNFEERASELLHNPKLMPKQIISLASILVSAKNYQFNEDEKKLIQSSLANDRDNTQQIVENWYKSIVDLLDIPDEIEWVKLHA